MIVSILSLIYRVRLPALYVSLHHCEWRQQHRLHEWTDPLPEAGRWLWSHCDVTREMKRRVRGSLWILPFNCLTLSQLLLAHHWFPYPMVGSFYKLVSHSPPAQLPLSHWRCNLSILLSPALPYLAMPIDALSTSVWATTILNSHP